MRSCIRPIHSSTFFLMSQTWRLSQDANKSSGTCSICLATRQLHHRDGTVHRHGPPCPGSNKPPLSVCKQSSAAQQSPVPADVPGSSATTRSSCVWSPGDFRFIKHIPKSARGACASHLSSLLRSVVSDPSSVTNWLGLFHWGSSILQPAKRCGKRHNLSTTLKKRISAFTAAVTPEKVTDSRQSKSQQTSADAKLSQAVAAKLEDGNVRAVIRLLMSDSSFAV